MQWEIIVPVGLAYGALAIQWGYTLARINVLEKNQERLERIVLNGSKK